MPFVPCNLLLNLSLQAEVPRAHREREEGDDGGELELGICRSQDGLAGTREQYAQRSQACAGEVTTVHYPGWTPLTSPDSLAGSVPLGSSPTRPGGRELWI